MAKQVFKWGQWNELAKAMGVKMPKPQEVNKAKFKVQQEKFARCRKCGGQMHYLKGTNVLICENEIEVEKTFENEDGTTTVKTVKQTCGNINLVDKEYQSYARFLFE